MPEHIQELIITKPDDFHVHLRDGEALKQTVPASARQFGRSIIMPNLVPPIITVKDALSYQNRILANIPKSSGFCPLMTLYLTDKTSIETIEQARSSGLIIACKLYPAGATTHSDAGVTQIDHIMPILKKMAEVSVPLLIHGEVTSPDIDIFDREAVFIEKFLTPLTKKIPTLKIVLEHITTKQAVQFVIDAPQNVAATLTPQHLGYNRNHMLAGGIRPHLYCLPVLKRQEHQLALQEAATSGNPKFFLGTDSAPHILNKKESACGCAGCYSAYAAIELYTEIFDELGQLDRLENFSSHFGADFYGIPRNKEKIRLIKKSWQAPHFVPFDKSNVVPLRAGEMLQWQLSS